MLTNSFLFLDRIGPASEAQLWRQGILSWDDFLAFPRIKGYPPLKKHSIGRHLLAAKRARVEGDASFFRSFPARHAWRLFEEFKDDAVYLDIETADYYGYITVIGLYDGKDTKTMVRGFNLDKGLLARELSQYKLIITFNGASFDLPVIRRYFGGVAPDIPHIDLRGVCAKVGLVGGLKKIEATMGIKRPDDLAYVYGDDACWLWHRFQQTKDLSYLDTLVRYNEEDIVNLKPIAERVIAELWKRIFIPPHEISESTCCSDSVHRSVPLARTSLTSSAGP